MKWANENMKIKRFTLKHATTAYTSSKKTLVISSLDLKKLYERVIST